MGLTILHLLSPLADSRRTGGSGEDAHHLLPGLLAEGGAGVTAHLLACDGTAAREAAAWLGRPVARLAGRGAGRWAGWGDRRLELPPSVDLVHAWGPLAAEAALHGREVRDELLAARIVLSLSEIPVDEREQLAVRELATATAAHVVVSSPHLADRLRPLGVWPDRVRVIAPPPAAPPERRAGHGPTLLVLPAASPTARTVNAVWAAAMLEQLHPTLRLLVYGDGPACDRVQRFARSLHAPQLTTFVGWSTPLPELLARADAIVYVGGDDSNATLLPTALASGRAVVAETSAAVAGRIEHGRTGLLTEADTPRRLAGEIQRLLSDPALARRLAGAAGEVAAGAAATPVAARYAELWSWMVTGAAVPAHAGGA